MATLKLQRPRLALGLIAFGVLALIASFFIIGHWAWIARMGGTMLVAGGAQWLPEMDRWLASHTWERLALGTALGAALVWMLVQYSTI